MIVNMIMVGVPSYQKIPRLHKKGSVTDKQTGGALPRDDKEPQSNSIWIIPSIHVNDSIIFIVQYNQDENSLKESVEQDYNTFFFRRNKNSLLPSWNLWFWRKCKLHVNFRFSEVFESFIGSVKPNYKHWNLLLLSSEGKDGIPSSKQIKVNTRRAGRSLTFFIYVAFDSNINTFVLKSERWGDYSKREPSCLSTVFDTWLSRWWFEKEAKVHGKQRGSL